MSCLVQKYLTISGLEFLVCFPKYCSCFAKTTVNTAVPNQRTVEAIVGILAKLSYRKTWKPAGLEIADSNFKALRNKYTKIKGLYFPIFTHASNSPLRPTRSGGCIQGAGQIYSRRKGKKQPTHLRETAQQHWNAAWEYMKIPKF